MDSLLIPLLHVHVNVYISRQAQQLYLLDFFSL